jgi:peptide/nickel transport system permease protein
MTRYILGRLLQAVPVVLGVATMLFLLLRMSGDPAIVMAGGESASPQVIAAVKLKFGLDRPLYEQYWLFVSQLAVLDFGESYSWHQPALSLVISRMPTTLLLTGSSFIASFVIGVPLGLIAALRRDTFLARFAMLFAFIGQSMPSFWLGILLILLFSVQLHWLPSFGSGDFRNLIMPVITISGFSIARNARLVRSGLLEVMSEDYIRTARSKGNDERIVVMRHAFKNMLIPVVTVSGLQLGFLVGGAVLAETIFAYPGVGSLLVQSVGTRDYPVVQATVFIIAVAVVLSSLAVDILYTYLDPRIRYG